MPIDGMPVNADISGTLELAQLIAEVTREMTGTVPAPRAAPFFGSDTELEYDLTALESLSSPGIFRKYETVLLLRDDLGGVARWLSRRLGCRVVGVGSDVRSSGAAVWLNHRARMDTEVFFAAGQPERLPFADRIFTHVWLVDPPEPLLLPQALAEDFRVLRSGAHFAAHLSGWTPPRLGSLRADLEAAGFVDPKVEDVRLLPPSRIGAGVRARVRARGGERHVRPAQATASHPASGYQVFCRRP